MIIRIQNRLRDVRWIMSASDRVNPPATCQRQVRVGVSPTLVLLDALLVMCFCGLVPQSSLLLPGAGPATWLLAPSPPVGCGEAVH